jgi:hypothetical protein
MPIADEGLEFILDRGTTFCPPNLVIDCILASLDKVNIPAIDDPEEQ